MPINQNRNKDDMAINLDTIIFHGEFYKLDLGNATMQLCVNTSVGIYSYRDPLF